MRATKAQISLSIHARHFMARLQNHWVLQNILTNKEGPIKSVRMRRLLLILHAAVLIRHKGPFKCPASDIYIINKNIFKKIKGPDSMEWYFETCDTYEYVKSLTFIFFQRNVITRDLPMNCTTIVRSLFSVIGVSTHSRFCTCVQKCFWKNKWIIGKVSYDYHVYFTQSSRTHTYIIFTPLNPTFI